ncbi:MAG: endonuclease III [Actinomycetota bacterium]
MRRRPATPDRAPPPSDRVAEILRRLRRRYGPLEPPPRREPLDELILTVLSQNTNDTNRDRAWSAMRARFPAWEDVAAARERDLIDTVRVGGLANTKAPRIQAILREVRAREGGFDLGWMRDAPVARVAEYLATLPGVGPKTIACVLAFSLRRPALPVDTHVHRVAARLGLIPPGIAPGPAHPAIEAVVPARSRIAMHVALIRLGRDACKAGRPRCEDCVLADLCPTAPAFLGTG